MKEYEVYMDDDGNVHGERVCLNCDSSRIDDVTAKDDAPFRRYVCANCGFSWEVHSAEEDS